mmetsp:Transcript_33478/g.66379  ORF Transcript_33478/g.66379 Transcript_33478/m.66379 type:complete len:99 (+) Transcript_33478:364-660(+)
MNKEREMNRERGKGRSAPGEGREEGGGGVRRRTCIAQKKRETLRSRETLQGEWGRHEKIQEGCFCLYLFIFFLSPTLNAAALAHPPSHLSPVVRAFYL